MFEAGRRGLYRSPCGCLWDYHDGRCLRPCGDHRRATVLDPTGRSAWWITEMIEARVWDLVEERYV